MATMKFIVQTSQYHLSLMYSIITIGLIMKNCIIFLLGATMFLKYIHANPTKRCANLFDEGCINTGVLNGGRDEDWIKNPERTPGKRNFNFNRIEPENLKGGYSMNGGQVEEWPNNINDDVAFEKMIKLYRTKKCANLFDEGCINNGVIGGGKDEEWITDSENTPGKRNVFGQNPGKTSNILKWLEDRFRNIQKSTNKRCANLFDEGCINGGIIGSQDNEDWLNGEGTPGKR